MVRLWHETDRLRPHREPEIQRIDLAGVVLEILAWGGDPATFEWFEAPAADRVVAALELLERLGAVERRRLTARGRQMQRIPLSPRLAAILLAANGAREAFLCAATSFHGVTVGDRQDASGQARLAHSNALVRRRARAATVLPGMLVPTLPLCC